MPTEIAIETGFLTVGRAFLFLSCRKFLLRALYSDLQALSSESAITHGGVSTPPPSASPHTISFELDTLPPPTIAPSNSSQKLKQRNARSSLHSTASRTLFSACFSESCMLFVLLMMQTTDMLAPQTRLVNWQFSLWFLMAAILLFVPLCVCLLIFVGAGSGIDRGRFLGPRVALSSMPVLIFLFAFSRIPLPLALQSSDLTTSTLSRLIVLGTIILGLLSGFGAVSNSWEFLPGLSRMRNDLTDHDIATAENSLSSIRNDLRRKQVEAERRARTPDTGTWFSRVVPSFRGSNGAQQEIAGLEALEYQMTRNLEMMRQRRDRIKFSGTFKGKLYDFCGRLFAIYCIVRVVFSLANVILPSRLRSPRSSDPNSKSNLHYSDLLTDLLASLVSFISPNKISVEDIAVFARQISLVLVGVIILTSIRLVLRGATRALRVTSRKLAASLMLLLLAQLMGTYLFSTIVQLRMSFPPPTHISTFSLLVPIGANVTQETNSTELSSAMNVTGPDVPTNLFSTIPEYEVFGGLFDGSFLLSATFFGLLKWGAEKVNGAGHAVS